MRAFTTKQYVLVAALFSLLAINYSGHEARISLFDSADLSSTGCNIAGTFKDANKKSLTCSNWSINKKAKIGEDQVSFSGSVRIERISKEISDGGSDDPSGQTTPTATSTKKTNVYQVVVTTTPSGCDDCTSTSETNEFWGSEYSSYDALEDAIIDHVRSQMATNANQIIKDVKDAKKAEKKEKEEERKQERREAKEDACLIERGTPLDEDEVELEGIDRLDCNAERLAEAKNLREADDIYNSQIKADLMRMLTSGSEEERSEARAILEGMKRGQYGKYTRNPMGSILYSLQINDWGRIYYDRLAKAQERLANTAPGSVGHIMAQQQVVGLQQEIVTTLSSQPLNPNLSEDFQAWTQLFADAGLSGLYNNHMVGDSRSLLANIVVNQGNRQERAIPGQTLLYNSQDTWNRISVPNLSPGYTGQLDQIALFGGDNMSVGRGGSRTGNGSLRGIPAAGSAVQ